MNMNEAKQIRIEESAQSWIQSGKATGSGSLWYNSPFRDEQEPSFKVNTERNLWYDFGAGKVVISSHWHRSYTHPTVCPTSWKG